MIRKLFWGLRAVLYKVRFGKILMPSYIGPPIFLYKEKNIYLGKKVRIYPGLRCECHNNGKVIIKDNVSIGQNLHITSSGNELIINKNTTISGNVFITNIDHDYKEVGKHILEQRYLEKKTIIGENCFIGYGVAIQAGTTLGKQCIVGAHSVVRGEFPDYSVIVGTPAKVIKKYNFETKMWEKV